MRTTGANLLWLQKCGLEKSISGGRTVLILLTFGMGVVPFGSTSK
jgi:hypothetical protein